MNICVSNKSVAGTPIIVTVQTQSQEQLDQLTAAVEANAQISSAVNGQRHLLGAIEATQSHVIDVQNAYSVTQVQSMPTLTLLENIAYNDSTDLWTLTYDTMAVDASVTGQVNQYDRVVYITKTGYSGASSDAGNECLNIGVGREECIQSLRENYVLLGPENYGGNTGDHLEYVANTDNTDTCPTCAIDASLAITPGTTLQQLTLKIPHQVIRQQLSRHSVITSELYGPETTIEFGVGMMFLPLQDANSGETSPNNILIFDKFSIHENTFSQLALIKQSSYSIAKHVAFWTAAAATNDADTNSQIRVTTVEYLLDHGHLLDDISASLNEGVLTQGGSMRQITQEDCDTMQGYIDKMVGDTTCLAKYRLCEPFKYVEGTGADLQTWAAVVFPIPYWHTSSSYQFNTLLRTNLTSANDRGGSIAYSTLNFVTNHAPRIACKSTTTQAFDATKHVRAEIYRGHTLAFEQIAGSFSVYNDSALSMAEALVTLVLRPDDVPAALQYFQTYTDEELRLDDLYMSHAKLEQTLPETIDNTVQGQGNGRSTLILDPELKTRCPQQTEVMDVGTCVTTHDWNNDGPPGLLRLPQGSTTVYYVHRVSLDDSGPGADADTLWLKDNIFGHSDPEVVEAFRNRVKTAPFSSPDASLRKPYAAVYWIWPVFSWPNTPPINLVRGGGRCP